MGSRPPAAGASVWKLGLAAATVAASLTANPARAYYEETHVTSDEARVTVDSAGKARVEHTLTWHVVAGQPRTLDLLGIEPLAQVDPTASLEGDDGRMVPATVASLEGRGVRLTVTEPKTVRHGHYRVRLAYGVDLTAAGELVREGAGFRLLWKGPTPREGYDAAKVTFVLPGALEEPRAIIGDGGMKDDGVLIALRRGADHDELELVRPHVGRGEEVVWAVHVAAKAFDAGRVSGPPEPPPLRGLEPRGHAPRVYAVLLLLAAGFVALVRLKELRFDSACRAFGARARGLVPLASWERAALGGAAFFVGLSLQLADMTMTGSLLVAFAMACAALRPPHQTPLARGPGRWLVLLPGEVFGRRAVPRDRFGFFTTLDCASVVGGFLVLVGAGYLLRSVQSDAAILLPLDAAALLPLLATGRRSLLPPDPSRAGVARLARIFRRLRGEQGLHISPWARVPRGAATFDELRLLAIPKASMPGLVGIEVGFSFRRTPTSFVSCPEVLVRVLEATAASALMTKLVPTLLPVPGLRPEERVYRLAPPWPTAASVAALVTSVGRELVDRRVADLVWEEEERRLPFGSPDVTQPDLALALA